MDQKYLQELIDKSEHKAAKWVTDLDTGFTAYWPAGETSHADVAQKLKMSRFEKGIVILENLREEE